MKAFNDFLLIVPFLIQALAMFIDEFYFHRKRGLPLWERVGHPIDTLSVLLCYLFLLLCVPSEQNQIIYIGLAALSCLIVTKDEFIHIKFCNPTENWLHAVLFILHPITFFSAAVIWKNQIDLTSHLLPALKTQALLTFIFMNYQLFYWNKIWKQK